MPPRDPAPKSSSVKPTRPPPRVRSEPPTIEEAVAAALGLADEPDHQVAIAAGLMGVSEDEVREPLLAARRAEAAAPPPRAPMATSSRRTAAPPVVVVERRRSFGVAPQVERVSVERVSLRPREPRR